MKRKLFVSHSSKTPETLALLRDVCAGFVREGFEVLVDKGIEQDADGNVDIYAGSDWDLRLNEWMAECHAAVILFSTAALQNSDWVKKEAAILSWRRELQKDFTLIPVMLEGTNADALQDGLYGVLRIAKDQAVTGATTALQIVDEVSQALGPAATTMTPFDRLQTVLAKILEHEADADTLIHAWNTLDGNNKPEWQPNTGQRFAAALVRFLLRNPLKAVRNLQVLLNEIRPKIKQERARELLNYLACLWVDSAAAAGISSTAHRGGAIGLNGNYIAEFTAQRYGERAWPMSNEWRLVQIDTSRRTASDILDIIRDTFKPRAARVPAKAIDRRIRSYADPVLVVLPAAQMPDEALLAELRQTFPNLVYLVSTGPTEPAYVPEGLIVLRPLLEPNIEEDQLFDLGEIQDFIDDRLYGSL